MQYTLHKVTTLPEVLEPNAVYYVKEGDRFRQIITDTAGTAVEERQLVWSEILSKPTTLSGFGLLVEADGRYLQSYTESDPVFNASAASGITTTNITNWSEAFSWGDHSGLYDKYISWNLKTNGIQRTTVQSGGTLDIVAINNIAVTYGAGGVVTLDGTHNHDGLYYTKALADGRFFNVTGDTVTGDSVFIGKTILDGNVWHDSNNGLQPFHITRYGENAAESVAHYLEDIIAHQYYQNDERHARFKWTINNTDTESNAGANANTHTFEFLGNEFGAYLYLDGQTIIHSGNISSYQAGAHTHPFNDITDVNINMPINGNVLQFNSVTGKWENVNYTSLGLQASDIDTLAELNNIVTDATLIDTNDPRLSDARPPTTHNHDSAYLKLTGGSLTGDLWTTGKINKFRFLNNLGVPADLDGASAIVFRDIADTNKEYIYMSDATEQPASFYFVGDSPIPADGVIPTANAYVFAGGFKVPNKNGFLKADGSVDSNTYLTSYTESDTLQSVTDRGAITTNSITAEILRANYGVELLNGNTKFLLYNNAGENGLYMRDITNGQMLTTWHPTKFQVNKDLQVDGTTNASTVNASSFIKSGGTSTQFLKADGSVDSSTYALDSDVVHKTGTETISGEKHFTSTQLRLSGHLYRNKFSTTQDVYDHYFPLGETGTTNANLRVWDGVNNTLRVLRFTGGGAFTWDGNTVFHTGNLTNVSQLTNDAGYLTSTTGDSAYVKKTGDTMTGELKVQIDGRAASFGINSNAPNTGIANQNNYIQIVSNGATESMGVVFHNAGISTSALEYVNTSSANGYFNLKSDDTTWDARINNNVIYHAGNLTNLTQLATRNYSDLQGIPSTFTPSTHTHGELIGTLISNLNTLSGTEKTLRYDRFSGDATGQHAGAINNANGVLTMYSHNGLYGKQLSFGDNDDLYLRRITNNAVQTWRKLWHDGNFNPANYAASSHGHVISDITNLQTTLDGKSSAADDQEIIINSADLPNDYTDDDVAQYISDNNLLTKVSSESVVITISRTYSTWALPYMNAYETRVLADYGTVENKSQLETALIS